MDYIKTPANIYVIRGWSLVNDQEEGEFVILCHMLTKGAVGQMITIDDEEGSTNDNFPWPMAKDDRTLY